MSLIDKRVALHVLALTSGVNVTVLYGSASPCHSPRPGRPSMLLGIPGILVLSIDHENSLWLPFTSLLATTRS